MIIRDIMEPKMNLNEVLENALDQRVDRLIGHDVPTEVQDYYVQAVQARDLKRRDKLTDAVLINKLRILLHGIDTSAMSSQEEKHLASILSKF